MAKKQRRSLVRSTGRVEEADLIRNARHLAENPETAAPRCICGNDKCPSRRIARELERVSRDRGDEKRLIRHTKGFFTHRVVRAYAATLLLALTGSVPYVANMRIGTNVVPYAVRGGALKEELVGFQHHDDRMLRLLSMHNLVVKKGLNFYAMEDEMLCSGTTPQPPDGFIAEKAKLLGLIEKAPGFHACPHITVVPESDHLMITWRGANARFLKCARCDGNANSLSRLFGHIGTASPREHFKVEAKLHRLDLYAGDEPNVPSEASASILDDYWKGKIGDGDLLRKTRAQRKQALQALPGPLYVRGDSFFASDARAFIEALDPDALERTALKAMLDGHDGVVVVEDDTAAKVIERFFPTRGEAALTAVAGDEAAAKRILAGGGSPMDKLRSAEKASKRTSIVGKLPSFKSIAPELAVLDAVAKEYRAHGRSEALRILIAEEKKMPTLRPLSAAVRRVLGGTRDDAWLLSKEEAELAEYATALVKELLECGPDSYVEAMEKVARGLGLEVPKKN
ncbi:MAG: hypothetical protein HY556_09115 [Euryarchaeota archaeon]|nr:hypothetical protein [Euryarchaeota archaeon]